MKIQDIIKDVEKTPEYWEETARLEFACLLDNVMNAHKVSEQELSESSGVSKRYISEVLGGNILGLKLSTIARLMYELGEKIIFNSRSLSEPIKTWETEFYNAEVDFISNKKNDIKSGVVAA